MQASQGQTSVETEPADTLTLDTQPPELQGKTFLLFKRPSPWHFVMAAKQKPRQVFPSDPLHSPYWFSLTEIVLGFVGGQIVRSVKVNIIV